MKSNRIIWGFVSLMVLTTISVLSVTQHSQIQQKPAQEDRRAKYHSQFPDTDYNASEPENINEREKRKEKNKRYDKYRMVANNPHPKTVETNLVEDIKLVSIPSSASDIIIVGEVLDARAYLSNNKTGVYSEFTIRIENILKNNGSDEIDKDKKITVDRPGGFVRYPNGQKVLYSVGQNGMPRIGNRYILFLTKPDQSPNNSILTGYELKDNKIYPLDSAYIFEPYKGVDATNFINSIKEAVSSPQKENDIKEAL